MYKMIVRRKVADVFAEISRGNWQAMVDGLGDPFHYRFHGDHALGGVRTTRAAVEQWWARIMRLIPGAEFQVLEVLVQGWPWRTRVATRIRIRGDFPVGAPYENIMFQFMTLRWGKVTDIETLENLQVLEQALSRVAASGQPEALAAPITD